jgi:exopolysaccharide biosynthesis polyprenyl glycosylphosphotransferase
LATFVTDVAMLAAAGLAAALSAPIAGIPSESGGSLAAFAFLLLLILRLAGSYRPSLRLDLLNEARTILGAAAIATMTIAFAQALFTDHSHAASQSARVWLFASAYLIAGRAGVHMHEARARAAGTAGERTLIIGAGRVGTAIAERLLELPQMGLIPVGFLDADPLVPDAIGMPVPVLGGPDDLDAVVERESVTYVLFAFSRAPDEVQLPVLRRCEELGLGVSFVPRFFERLPDQTKLERLGGLPLVATEPVDPAGWRFVAKYSFDRAMAAVSLIVLSPLLLATAIAVRVGIGSPVLFRQERIGRNGRRFEMLKFRTMSGNPEHAGLRQADAEWAERMVASGGAVASPAENGDDADERTTGTGRFLRRWGLDELPQLFNVLRGEMSFIGPRPERPSYVSAFERSVRHYDERHRVKSGITGWAQVHGLRGESPLDQRVEHDNYYIANWSPWLDFKVLVLTARETFRHGRNRSRT